VRICVTGGAGYIGSITVRLLLDRGHQCVVLDTLEKGWREAVDPRADLVVGSVGDAAAVAQALRDCHGVIHLAGYIEVAESQSDPERYFRNNSQAPLVLLDGMMQQGVGALVFSSTAAVYGEPESIPITEDAATRPVNAYGDSKLRFERSVESYRARGLRATVLRYFNVAGASRDGSLGEAHVPETHIIPRVLTAMLEGQQRFEVFGGDYPTRDGTCVRDYIHVVDLAGAHLLAIQQLVSGGPGSTYNLGNGTGYSNLQVVRTCAQATGRDVEVAVGPRRAGDPATLVASAARAERELGWRREYPELGTIVDDAWRWHLAHPNGYR